MTHADLYKNASFKDLFTDERFVALMMYLKDNRPRATQTEPHGMIQDSGRIEAYLDLLEKIDRVGRPPVLSGGTVERGIPYNSTQTLNQTH